MALKMAILQIIHLAMLFATSATAYDQQALEYLQKFGYLPETARDIAAAYSETVVEEAIRELQLYGKVPVTGKIDAATRELMSRKRCGLSDRPQYLTGRHRRRRHRKRFVLMGSKWEKKLITYSVDNPSRSIADLGAVRREITEAVSAWRRAVPLQFREVRPEAGADIRISFAVGDHGDPYQFDGSGRILAHAFPPGEGIGGDVHLDDDEHWTVALTGDPYNHLVSLRSIAMHEIGHSIGLSHSQEPDSIMYSFYQYDRPPRLAYDDMLAVRTLYGGDYNEPRVPSYATSSPLSPQTTQSPVLPRAPEQPSDRHPTTDVPELPTAEPDPCTATYDAIASIRQEIFIFKDGWFWRILQDGTLSQNPRPINTLWKEAAWPVDAAVESDHKIYMFVGKDIYIFDGQQLVSKRTLTELGLPDTVDRVRLVYTWNYWTEKPMYIWTKEEFWRVDKKSEKVEIGYPRKIATTWHGVPEQASAAVTYNNELYFFDDIRAYKFHTINMTVAPPINVSQLWRFCPVAIKMSRGHVTHTRSDVYLLLMLLSLLQLTL